MSAEKHHIGHFSARILPALKPFVDYGREQHPFHFTSGHVILEPHAERGVYVIGLTGHAMGIIHDPEGHIDEPVTLDFPDTAFAAADAPAAITMSFEGDAYEAPLPEWTQPDRVYVSTAGTFIVPKMRHPHWAEESDYFHPCLYQRTTGSKSMHHSGIDYRMTEGRVAEWRKALDAALSGKPRQTSGEFINPDVPALFKGFSDLFANNREQVRIHHQFVDCSPNYDANGSPIIVRCAGHPEFIGLYMMMRHTEIEEVPTHFRAAAAAWNATTRNSNGGDHG